MAVAWCEERVNVIRHHAPGVKRVPITVEMEQSILDDSSKPFVTQDAGAISAMEKFVNSLSPLTILFNAISIRRRTRSDQICSKLGQELLRQ
jgi:hypothetical protein